MESFMSGIMPYLIGIVTAVLMSIAGFLGKKADLFLDAKIAKSKREMIYDYAVKAVKAVEQLTKELDVDPTEKFEMAKEDVLAWANDLGITLTEKQIQTIIESTVNEFKEALE